MEWYRFSMYGNPDNNFIEAWLFKHGLPQARKLIVEHWTDIAAIGQLLQERERLNQIEVEAALANGAKKRGRTARHNQMEHKRPVPACVG
jgi:hypothetical protein